MHTGILPLTMVILMSFHFFKIRKAGGIVIPESKAGEKPKKVSVIPNLIMREFVVALSLIAFILILSTFFNAPFGDRANPAITPNPTKAPWYFMGFQELILHFHPFIAVVVLPIGMLVLMFYLPGIKNVTPNMGVWFLSPTGKRLAGYASILALIFTAAFILLDEYWLSSIAIFKHGIVYFAAFLIFIILGGFMVKTRFKTNRAELIQTISIFIIASFIIFTLTGIFFRGTGMHLTF